MRLVPLNRLVPVQNAPVDCPLVALMLHQVHSWCLQAHAVHQHLLATGVCHCCLPPAVSRSEQGQQKRLLLLDANWKHVEDIPLDIGRRFFTLTPPSLAMGTSHAAVAAAAPWKLAGVPSILNNRSQQDQVAGLQEASVLSLSPLLSDSTVPDAVNGTGAAAEAQGGPTDSADAAAGSAAAQGHLAALWEQGVLRTGDHVKLVLPVSDVTPEAEQLQRQFSERGGSSRLDGTPPAPHPVTEHMAGAYSSCC
jgi:hypothetical protein